MARVRIHTLAREMNISNHDLIAMLGELGIVVKSHSSTIEESTAREIKKMAAEEEAKKAAAAAPPPAVEPAPEPVKLEDVSVTREEEAAPAVEEEKEPAAPLPIPPLPSEGRTVKIPPVITVHELADRIQIPVNEVIKRMMRMNILRSANQSIPSDIASRVLEEFGFTAAVERLRPAERLKEGERDKLFPAAPVVTIMGHVDHGKTTLLDFIRKSNVAEMEAGRITQRIGAYEVQHNGKKIVFLDTPGHEAFTAMRARGAHVTDVAVLVVAADDGVMPQTEEAIDHARAAGVPMIVAINKVDRPEANVERVKQQLVDHDLVPHDWGGTIECIPVSAKTGQGVDNLIETILLMAEMEDLRANPQGAARGTVIEAEMEAQRGPVATVLIREGTLRLGDYIVAGGAWGRVRRMLNYRSDTIDVAAAVTPVSIIGFQSVPHASDQFQAVTDARVARERAARFEAETRESRMLGHAHVTLEELFSQIKKGEIKELRVIVKADQQGTVEAVAQSLQKPVTDEARVRVIHRGVGNIVESDVMLAAASNAVIIGFSVQSDASSRALAEREKIEIRTYDVIYNAINDIEAALLGLLEPIKEERVIGEAEVLALFKSTRAGTIAGCRVRTGRVQRNSIARVLRNAARIFEGPLDSLRHLKEDVNEIAAGMECGISLKAFNDFQVGDTIQSVILEEVPRAVRRRT